MNQEEQFWTNRYLNQKTGWDIGNVSTPIKDYVDQLANKELRILLPGAGNAYEAEYLWTNGFVHTHVLDISDIPLSNLAERVPDFPTEQLIKGDFFDFEGQFDLIIEQTFFCSFSPTPILRQAYADQMYDLLVPGGKLVGVWFDIPLDPDGNRPYGGGMSEYRSYFADRFSSVDFQSCHNSIKPRLGNELFGIIVK